VSRYFGALRVPIVLALANFFILQPVAGLLPRPWSNTVFNALRALIIMLGGWTIVRRGVGGPWAASWAGPAVLFVDHVVLKGGVFLLAAVVGRNASPVLAFAGVLGSYVLYAPVTLALGWVGGTLAARRAPGVVSAGPRRSVGEAAEFQRPRNAFRAVILIAALCGLASAQLAGPAAYAAAPQFDPSVGNLAWAGIGAIQVIIGVLAPVGLFLFWSPSRVLVLIDIAWTVLGLLHDPAPLGGPPVSQVLFVADIVLNVGLAAFAFAPPLRGLFSREPGFARVMLVSWGVLTALFVLMIALANLFGIPSSWRTGP